MQPCVQLDINVFYLILGLFVLVLVFGRIVLIISRANFQDGLSAGEGKPTEDLIGKVAGQTIRVLSFISEKDGAFLLADKLFLDKGKEKIFCRIKLWNTDGSFCSSPTLGRLYKIKITSEESEVVVCFDSVVKTS
jgi:hypothetical protein